MLIQQERKCHPPLDIYDYGIKSIKLYDQPYFIYPIQLFYWEKIPPFCIFSVVMTENNTAFGDITLVKKSVFSSLMILNLSQENH